MTDCQSAAIERALIPVVVKPTIGPIIDPKTVVIAAGISAKAIFKLLKKIEYKNHKLNMKRNVTSFNLLQDKCSPLNKSMLIITSKNLNANTTNACQRLVSMNGISQYKSAVACRLTSLAR